MEHIERSAIALRQPVEVIGSWLDITKQKQLEDELRQSKKLDELDPENSEPIGSECSLPGTETILLAEDDDSVRTLASMALAKCGYTVLEARDGQKALRLAEIHVGQIQLLLTDVAMPMMGGRILAERVTIIRPDIKVLFMSGCTDSVIAQHGGLQANAMFVSKPFSSKSLTRKIRNLLDVSGEMATDSLELDRRLCAS